MTAKRNRRKNSVPFDERLQRAADEARAGSRAVAARRSTRCIVEKGKASGDRCSSERMVDITRPAIAALT
ncbi:hypothetical protein [Bradyrhizobium sp. USDA 10063]